MSGSDQAQTPLSDLVGRALKTMELGPRLLLDSLPGDPSMASHSFGPGVAMQIAAEVRAKDWVYAERNQIVALLARLYPSGIKRTEIEGWEPEWHGCVYIDLPNGQASWHYHDRDAHLFEHLPPYGGDWDGHTTREKYERIAKLCLELDQHCSM